ncbi:MAG: preprotein translocase subunit SecE [Actinomycetia bacterium]|nr:preprotein translocase subunit SecE [Actinomycetes bacterium]
MDRPGEEPAEPEDHQASEAEDDLEQSEEAEEAEEEARSAVSTKAVRKVRSTKAPVKKSGVKTPSRKESRAKVTVEKRTTPFQFVRESVAELRKVVWPTRLQMQTYFVVVLVFVLFVIALVGLLDFGLGWALLRIFG